VPVEPLRGSTGWFGWHLVGEEVVEGRFPDFPAADSLVGKRKHRKIRHLDTDFPLFPFFPIKKWDSRDLFFWLAQLFEKI
jgi:hypothetical protein